MTYKKMTEKDFEGFTKVVITEDWENMAKTASIRKGAIGYISANYGSHVDVNFLPEMEELVKSNTVNMLACNGVPSRIAMRHKWFENTQAKQRHRKRGLIDDT